MNTNPFNIEDSDYIGTEITTKHANSLTNGPTLYITNNIENICNYFMKLSNIDKTTVQKIEHKIEENSKLCEIISNKQKDYEDKIEAIQNKKSQGIWFYIKDVSKTSRGQRKAVLQFRFVKQFFNNNNWNTISKLFVILYI